VAAGADEYESKPVNFTRLCEKITTLLATNAPSAS